MKHMRSEVDFTRSDNLQRPPFDPQLRTTTKPLFVTPTLVARVDSTDWNDRPHDKGSSVDRDGDEVRHPEEHPGSLALEPNEILAFERWDEYWRKVHGPKFAYEEPGSSSQLVLRYDQLHRLPSGPSSAFRPPYRAMVDSKGKLVSDPEKHVPPYARPKWDGLAYIAYAAEQDIEKTLEKQDQYAKRIIADEQVAFRVVTREICQEFIFIPAKEHRTAFSLVQVQSRHSGLSRDEYRKRMLKEHAREILSKPATHAYVKRYVQLHNIGSTQDDPEGSKIDSISVLGFSSLNDVEDYLSSADYAHVEWDESALISSSGSEFWTAANYSVINRLLPELATESNDTE
jgi:hypothetical protein